MTEHRQKTIGIAIASMVLGILGVLIGPLCAIPAIICGHIAKSKIKKDPQTLGGVKQAQAGLVLGYLQIGFTAAFIIGLLLKAPAKRINQTRCSIARLSFGVDCYRTDLRKMPASLSLLVENDGLLNWHGPYIEKGTDELLDIWGTPFDYQVEGETFKIKSAGPDRTLNTSDDIEYP